MCCSYTCTKVTLIIFNVIFMLSGLAVFVVGLYVRLLHTEYDIVVGSALIYIGTYVMMAVGILVVAFVTMIGCIAAIRESRHLLVIYMVFLGIVFLSEAASTIAGFWFSCRQVESILSGTVLTAIMTKYGYEENQAISDAINLMQQQLQCCGFSSPQDWTSAAFYHDTNPTILALRNDSLLPMSCCLDLNQWGCNTNLTSSEIYTTGCLTVLMAMIEKNLVLVGAVSIAMAILQIFGGCLAFALCHQVTHKMRIQDQRQEDDETPSFEIKEESPVVASPKVEEPSQKLPIHRKDESLRKYTNHRIEAEDYPL